MTPDDWLIQDWEATAALLDKAGIRRHPYGGTELEIMLAARLQQLLATWTPPEEGALLRTIQQAADEVVALFDAGESGLSLDFTKPNLLRFHLRQLTKLHDALRAYQERAPR